MEVIFAALESLFTLENFLIANIGVFIGVIFGAIPGLSATIGVTVFIPFTFSMGAVPAILMLCGIFFGSNFGGSIPAILVNTPGTNGAVATLLDGYPLARKGHPLKALDMALIASTFGGIVSALALLLFAPQISKIALFFGPPEYVTLAIFGLSIIASISGNSILKGLISGALGMLIATVGIDSISGLTRFTFNNIHMTNGLSLVSVLLGVYAVGQIISRVNEAEKGESLKAFEVKGQKDDRLSLKEFKEMTPTMAKSSVIGTVVGAIPGAGSAIAAFLAYNEAQRTAKPEEKFGEGELKGIAASESANNGATASCMIPLLTLGIPGDAVTAILLGAFTMHGLRPGPRLFEESGNYMYAILIGCLISMIFMYIQGRYLMPAFAKIIHVPQTLLTAFLIIICSAGAFAVSNSIFDLNVMIFFGIVAYIIVKFDFPTVPIVLGIVLGPIAESNLRNSLAISNGSWLIFLQRPIALLFIIITIVFVVVLKKTEKKRANN